MQETADLIIRAWHIVTMNPARDILLDQAVAVRGRRICAIGAPDDLRRRFPGAREIGGQRFVLAPGMVNTHIHVTGETLFKSFIPDHLGFEEHVFEWLGPLLAARRPGDDRLAARLTAVEMLRSGTTCFLEAGSSQFLDETVDALLETGIRGRVGGWIWDVPDEPAPYRQTTDQAIARLQDQLERYPDRDGGLIAAWAILVGHTTGTEHLWRAATALAMEHAAGFAFHMSPDAIDIRDFDRRYGRRPLERLADIGVMDQRPVVTHLVHASDSEIDILAQSGAHVSHCPTSAMRCGYGVTQIGRFPEMADRRINVTIGTDAANSANHADLMRAAHAVAGLFKDARRDPSIFPAAQVFEMATLGGARALRLDDEIGSIEVGKYADLVLHDTDRPEWRPLLDVVNQLIWSADGRGVHTVLVDGRIVVENGRCVTVDEDALWREAQQAGEALVARFGKPMRDGTRALPPSPNHDWRRT
ncbi:amidohydrolase [Sphingomonas sp. Root50]|nr:amidohydrolase [Sphingomonas sp. Root1294]KQY68437.1 amidohydrolase [Sphingomonas sp. Root50]KRB91394.1 amidohydrolase [Sphingomonas sp. Root720]